MAEKKDKLRLIQQLLASAKNSIHSAEQILKAITGTSSDATSNAKEKAKDLSSFDGKVIEGVFDGEKMIGPDKKEYKVPENYASKSKLVEGDTLKLTIAEDGSFIFKQIGPVPRKKVIGTLTKENDGFKVIADGKTHKVLQASVTYYKANDGDKVTIVVPEAEESEWGAIENVVTTQSVVTDEDTDSSKAMDGTDGEAIDKVVEEKIQETVSDAVAQSNEAEAAIKTEKSPEPKKTEATAKKDDEPTEGVKELEI